MKEEKDKTEYVTRIDLEEQTQIILSAFDKRFTALDKNLEETKRELKADINNVQTLIDGYVKAQEEFRQEFTIMKEEFKHMKQIIKEKLGIEIKAI